MPDDSSESEQRPGRSTVSDGETHTLRGLWAVGLIALGKVLWNWARGVGLKKREEKRKEKRRAEKICLIYRHRVLELD